MNESGRLRLCALEEIAAGAIRKVAIPGYRALAVYNVDGAIFVSDDACTHGMGSLSEGILDGDVIECPWHGGAFNVRSGEAVFPPCVDPVRVYSVCIEDGVIWISPAPAVTRPPGRPVSRSSGSVS